MQGASLNGEHLNTGRIKPYSSIMLILASSAYSPLEEIQFRKQSIHLRRIACKVTL
jgi:hypothetical protein